MDRGDPLQRAMVALNSQRPQEAERIAQDILKADPRHGKALHVLGCALLMQGRAQEAVAPLESAARGGTIRRSKLSLPWRRSKAAGRTTH